MRVSDDYIRGEVRAFVSGSEVISVSSLNQWVATLIDQSLPSMWVSGEVRNFVRAASGHWYFSLKDAGAEVRCAMFAGANRRLGFIPRNGDKVEVHAKAGLYQPRGDFQLVADSMRYAGLGQLYEQFLRLKSQLQAEGLFSSARKKTLAGIYFRIGVVTSLKAAALRDVISTLKRRAPYADIVIYPCAVQGDGAAQEICQALLQADERDDVDVLLLVRGGGSLQDLWAFNQEILARTLVQLRLPVVCGVGHESDVTIADWVCDVRAATPTAAAEMVTPPLQVLIDRIETQRQMLFHGFERCLQMQQQRLDWASSQLQKPGVLIEQNARKVHQYRQSLWQIWLWYHSSMNNRLMSATHALCLSKPDPNDAQIKLMREQLNSSIKEKLQLSMARLKQMRLIFESMKPETVLKLGYAMLTDEHGKIVSQVQDTHPGQNLHIHLSDGIVTTTVNECEQHD